MVVVDFPGGIGFGALLSITISSLAAAESQSIKSQEFSTFSIAYLSGGLLIELASEMFKISFKSAENQVENIK